MQTVIEYSRLGDPDVLEVAEHPEPTPGEGKVLVDVRAIGVNPFDTKVRRGVRPSPPIDKPRRIGSDAAGVISAVGPGVTQWSVGDEVVVHGASGAYASKLVASVGKLVPKPANVPFDKAAALGVPAGTAYQVVESLGPVEGDVLLVHGASGAVGQAVIQFARQRGATVVGTSSAANLERVRELGAIALEYGDGLVERVRVAVPQGVDYVLDGAGTDAALQASFELVSDRSRIGTIVVGAKAPELGIRAWSGGSAVPLTAEENALRDKGVEVALAGLANGTFDVEIGAEYPLKNAVQAHRDVEAGTYRGKLILVP